jgi:hypothetical protein
MRTIVFYWFLRYGGDEGRMTEDDVLETTDDRWWMTRMGEDEGSPTGEEMK